MPVILIGVFLIGSFSLYIYRNTYNNVLGNLIEDKQNFTRQIKNNLEQKVRTVEYAFTTYSATSDFKKIIEKPLDFHNYAEVKEVSSELAYIGIMGIENTDYSLISLSQNWRIRGGGLEQLSESQTESYQKLISQAEENLLWLPEEDKIQMLVSLPIFSQNRSGLGMVEISQSVITDLIGETEDRFFDIYNSQGDLLYQHGAMIPKEIAATVQNQASETFNQVKAKNGDVYLFQRANYNQWLYVSRLPKSVIQQATSGLKTGLIVIALVALILLVLLAYIVADRSVRPFAQIKDRLSKAHGVSGKQVELTEILSGIENIVTENETLSTRVQRQKPELEQLFIFNLFRGRVDRADLNGRLQQFNYHFTHQRFVTMLIQIDDLGDLREESARDLFLLSIEKVVEDIVPPEHRMRPIILNAETQSTILVFGENEDWHKMTLDYANQLQETCRKFLKVKISVGLSHDYIDLSMSKQAVDNAKEALHFRINLGTEAIIFYSEIASQLNETAVLKYPKAEESALLDAIRAGDEKDLRENFCLVLNKIFSENHNPLSVETAILKLTNNVVQLGQLLGADFEIFQHNRHIYSDVLNVDDPKKIEKILYHSLILPIVDTIQDKTDRQLKSLSEKIVHIVHQKYDEDLSLESIADMLHYNPNYLSSVFKKEFGSNFGDYLQNYRLEIAKKWLLETNMTVKEISQRLQYNNPQNFIRFFKKKDGITPGEFRREHTAE
ncbi:helix-turn-helix transcriptional regulator [Enterococcus timonensis]|uniref:helix-turn-helix transcriptional regulator n=1 Tax=Enterococcus timonensis TaxID=1852364 RepID=UPI000A6A07EA|nr:helix-turn-helix domain-containing protein [Enterococcus timonensis]